MEAARREIDRIQANPDNKMQVEDSFDRVLKPEHMAKVKALKASIKPDAAAVGRGGGGGVSESLRQYIAARGLDEVSVLNELQEHGVISDNAVSVADVGNGGAAIAWLEKRDQRRFRERETLGGTQL
jgi:hypothetical protein